MKIISFDVGFKNLGVCVFEPPHRIAFWRVLNIPAQNLCRGLVQTLKPHQAHFDDADVVLVERQSKKSMKMLSLAAYLETFFTLQDKHVVLYSPLMKLLGTGQENSGAENYRNRKKAAINLTNDFLAANPQEPDIHGMWEALKKKDDAADALTQVLAYVRGKPEGSLESSAIRKPSVGPVLTFRKPTPKQLASKKYTANAVMWLLRHQYSAKAEKVFYVVPISQEERLERCISQDKAFTKAVLRHFTDVKACVDAFGRLCDPKGKSEDSAPPIPINSPDEAVCDTVGGRDEADQG